MILAMLSGFIRRIVGAHQSGWYQICSEKRVLISHKRTSRASSTRENDVLSTPSEGAERCTRSSAPSRPDTAGRLPRTRFPVPVETGRIQPPMFTPAESLVWSLMANSRCAMALMGSFCIIWQPSPVNLCSTWVQRPRQVIRSSVANFPPACCQEPPVRPQGSFRSLWPAGEVLDGGYSAPDHFLGW